VTYQF
jgi:hypothetical protein